MKTKSTADKIVDLLNQDGDKARAEYEKRVTANERYRLKKDVKLRGYGYKGAKDK